jgi:hypothetical protein
MLSIPDVRTMLIDKLPIVDFDRSVHYGELVPWERKSTREAFDLIDAYSDWRLPEQHSSGSIDIFAPALLQSQDLHQQGESVGDINSDDWLKN